MSYHVDPEILLFDDLDEHDAVELELFAKRIVLQGKADMDHPAFRQWSSAAKYDNRQALLVHATAFPQRALLSLLAFWREKDHWTYPPDSIENPTL